MTKYVEKPLLLRVKRTKDSEEFPKTGKCADLERVIRIFKSGSTKGVTGGVLEILGVPEIDGVMAIEGVAEIEIEIEGEGEGICESVGVMVMEWLRE
jgi:hypothetical protein